MSGNNKKYTSERQALIYQLAEKEGIEIGSNRAFINFMKKKKQEIDALLGNIGEKNKFGRDYTKAILEYSKKNELYKEIPLSQLLQIFSIHQNEKGYRDLGIDSDSVLVFPKNKILNDDLVNKDRGVIRSEDLENAQSDNKYGYSAELLANAIDASVKEDSIGRFGEGFLQVIDKIKDPQSKVIVSTKYEGEQGYDIFLTKKATGKFGDASMENYFSSRRNKKTTTGTSVKLQKDFNQNEQGEIREYILKKFKTNSRANILFNGELINNLEGYRYINGEDLDVSNMPTVEVKLGNAELEFIDHGIGMTSDTIVNKLLKPNATGNIRKSLSDKEVIETTPKQTKFFYNKKKDSSEKTQISLNISGVKIEGFEVETFGNIGDFTLEFPTSSPLKDSRNEIEISREVSTAMKISLEKIDAKSENIQEKLDLLEIIGVIYEKLKDKSSNIVDEQFVLSTVLKKGFYNIRESLEKNGISVLPANKELLDNLGYPEKTFYISEEFVDFDIKNVRNKKEIERVNPAVIKKSFIGEEYTFYEVPFVENADYDYFTYNDTVFVNSTLLDGKEEHQKDDIIMGINVGVNLNTSYETEPSVVNFGRILTSGEEFFKKKKRQKNGDSFISSKQEEAKKDENHDVIVETEERVRLIDEEKREKEIGLVLDDLDTFRQKYQGKISIDPTWYSYENIRTWIIATVDRGDYKHIRDKTLALFKTNLTLGLEINYGVKHIETNDYVGHLNHITSFVDTKSEKVTKPFVKFLGKIYKSYIDNKEMNSSFNNDFGEYLETLIKILIKDPKIGVELMERFGEKYGEKYGYDIFKDYFDLEKLNNEEQSIKSVEKSGGYYENSFLNSRYNFFIKNYEKLINKEISLLNLRALYGNVFDGIEEGCDFSIMYNHVKRYTDYRRILRFRKILKNAFDSGVETPYEKIEGEFPDFLRVSTTYFWYKYFQKEDEIVKNFGKKNSTNKEEVEKVGEDDYFENSFLNSKYGWFTKDFFESIAIHGVSDKVNPQIGITYPVDNWTFTHFSEILKMVESGKMSRQHFVGLKNIIHQCVSVDQDEDFPKSKTVIEYIRRNNLESILRENISANGLSERIFILNDYFNAENDLVTQLNGLENVDEYTQDSFLDSKYKEPVETFFNILSHGVWDFTEMKTKYGVTLSGGSWTYGYFTKVFEVLQSNGINEEIFEGLKNAINDSLNGGEDVLDYLLEHNLGEVLRSWIPEENIGSIINILTLYFAIEEDIIGQLKEQEKQKEYINSSFLNSKYDEVRERYFEFIEYYSENGNFGGQGFEYLQDQYQIKFPEIFEGSFRHIRVFELLNGKLSKEQIFALKNLSLEYIHDTQADYSKFENYIKNEKIADICYKSVPFQEPYMLATFLAHYFQMEDSIITQLKENEEKNQGKFKEEGDYFENSFLNPEYRDVTEIYSDYIDSWNDGTLTRQKEDKFNKDAKEQFGVVFSRNYGHAQIYRRLIILLSDKVISSTVAGNLKELVLKCNDFKDGKYFKQLNGILPDWKPLLGLSDESDALWELKCYFEEEDLIINQMKKYKVNKKDSFEEKPWEERITEKFMDTRFGDYDKITTEIAEKIVELKAQSEGTFFKNAEQEVMNILVKNGALLEDIEIYKSELAILIDLLEHPEGPFAKDYWNEVVAGTFLEEHFGILDRDGKVKISNSYLSQIYSDGYSYDDVGVGEPVIDMLRGKFFLDMLFLKNEENAEKTWEERIKEKFIETKPDDYQVIIDKIVDIRTCQGRDALDYEESLEEVKEFLLNKGIPEEVIDEYKEQIEAFYVLSSGEKEKYVTLKTEEWFGIERDIFLRKVGEMEKIIRRNELVDTHITQLYRNSGLNSYFVSPFRTKFLFDKLFLAKEDALEHKKKLEQLKQSNKLDIFTELSKTYPQDLITFVQFLKSGGEFLEDKESKIGKLEGQMNIQLSDLIGINLSRQNDVKNAHALTNILLLQQEQEKAGIIHEDKKELIAGVNIAQDEGGMLFYREGTQNAIDAIRRYNNELPEGAKKLEEKVDWETYSVGNNFVSSISDPVGMDLPTVINNLFTPYNTGKGDGKSTGKFGKGFFTFSPASKQINIKTSTGDGKVLYISLTPQKENGIINDFDIAIDQKDEEFQGTTIERIDEADGISGNLRAMIGSNLLKKYVGNVEGINANYNGTVLNKGSNLDLVNASGDIIGKDESGEEKNLGSLELFKNRDNISRFTKDGLFISEIKQDLLTDFPDWVVKEFEDAKLSINIPSEVPLVGSRNSIKNREYYIGLLKPYFYKQVIDFLLTSYVSRSIKIPELPDDYLGMKRYDYSHTYRVSELADRFNAGNRVDFEINDINYLKDEKIMAEFLVLSEFQMDGETTSLMKIKQQLLDKEVLQNAHRFGESFQDKAQQGVRLHQMDEKNQQGEKHSLTMDEIEEKSGIDSNQINTFENMISENKGIQYLIKTHFSGNFDISYSDLPGGFPADSFSKGQYGMSLSVVSSIFTTLITDYNTPKVFEELLKNITHEMAHNLEGGDWGTHNDAFKKIQKRLTTDYHRNV